MALAYTPERLRAMQESLRAELAERKLWYFVREAWPILEPGTPFRDSWSIGAICEHLEALSSLEIKRLLLNMPRRRGKSLLSAVFWFCWGWIKEPWERWSYISYGSELSERDSKKCRDIIVSPWYQKWFGNRFKIKNDQNAASRFENDKQGYRMATSVGGKTIGWGAGVNCLPYDRLVLTDGGLVPIGEIVESGLPRTVAAFDHKTQGIVYRQIFDRFKSEYNSSNGNLLFRIQTQNGHSLELTAEHPVYVVGKGYVEARGVCVGDEVVVHDRDPVRSMPNESHGKAFTSKKWPGKVLFQHLHGQSTERSESSAISPSRFGLRATSVVVAVESIGSAGTIYNISVAEHNNYFADGILVHNCADDITNFQDAWSPTLLRKAVDVWMQGVHQSVNDPLKSKYLVTAQQLNEMDLPNQILRGDYGYETLILPEEYEPCRVFFTKDEAKRSKERAPIVMTKLQRERPTVKYGAKTFQIRDPRTQEGELLSPERFPMEVIEGQKKLLGPYQYAAQAQQRAAPLEGTIFKLNMFRYFREEWRDSGKVLVLQWVEGGQLKKRVIPIKHCRFFQTIDTAMKTQEQHDYTAIGTWVLTPTSDLLLYHAWRGKVSIPYQFALLESFRRGRSVWDDEASEVRFLQEWPRRLIFQAVEEKASGIGLIQQSHAAGIPFKPLAADVDPMVRIGPVAALYSSGLVYHYEGAAWLPDYEAELLGFPNAAHDDQVSFASHAGYLVQHDVILRTGLSRPLIASDEVTTREAERLAGIEDENKVKLSIGGVDVEFDFDD